MMKGEKKMIEAMLCLDELIQFLHFFQFFGKKLYFKLTSSTSNGSQISNFCIVFFIFQWVQSLRGSRRVEWLHVDGRLSKIKLELVIDNPILLSMGHQICFFSVETKLTILSTSKSLLLIRKLRFSVVLFCG